MYFHIGTNMTASTKLTALIGFFCGFLFGGWSELLTALLLLNGLDILLGLMTATKKRNLSSNLMYLGVKKKMGMWIGLILANVVDITLFQGQGTAITGLLFVFISYEGLSIIESLDLLGVPIPDRLKQSVENMGNQENNFEIKIQDTPAPDVKKVIIKDVEGNIQEIGR